MRGRRARAETRKGSGPKPVRVVRVALCSRATRGGRRLPHTTMMTQMVGMNGRLARAKSGPPSDSDTAGRVCVLRARTHARADLTEPRDPVSPCRPWPGQSSVFKIYGIQNEFINVFCFKSIT